MNIHSKVVEVAERRVGEDEVDACSRAPETRTIRLRGDQASMAWRGQTEWVRSSTISWRA